MSSFDIVYSLLQIKGVGPKTLQKWVNAEWLQEGPEPHTLDINDIDALVRRMADSSSRIYYPGKESLRKSLGRAAMVRKTHLDMGVQVISWFCPEYPDRLKVFADCPPILYAKGDLSVLEREVVTMVGSRQPDDYTARSMHRIAERVTGWGQVVLSGLAEGCDFQSHRGCLAAGGPTIAVLAGGIDNIYPARHRGLAGEIIKTGGLLISTSELGTEPTDFLFVHRDRLQVQLSDRVICGLAKPNSGSLHACKATTDLGIPLATVKSGPSMSNVELVDLVGGYGARLLANKDDLKVFLGV